MTEQREQVTPRQAKPNSQWVGSSPQAQARLPPQVIIHGSLAQNLRQQGLQNVALPPQTSASYEGTYSAKSNTSISTAAMTGPGASVSGTSQSSLSVSRDRARSGTQTPREMVWVDSKERLSEMATNIRGISNALSNVALAVMVKRVLIVTKLSDDELVSKTTKVAEWLLRWKPSQVTGKASKSEADILEMRTSSCSRGDLEVFVEDVLARRPEFDFDGLRERNPDFAHNLKTWSPESVAQHAEEIDLVVTLGGDGTVLYTSWLFQKMVPPTLSFGLGSLGFMTENKFDDFEATLSEHLVKGISCALRMRFECTVMRTRNTHKCGSEDLEFEMLEAGKTCQFASHTRDGEFTILNEVVVDRGPNPFVTMTELYGNYELLTSIKADGVVISTPTGSTAYSMSAGGSLVHPDIPAQLISPICPHTLSFRPLVVPDSMVLHIGVPYDARSSAFVSFDGKARVELRRGDFLAINVSRYPFPKVLQEQYQSVSWVQQLSRTLHWNEQKRPKRYTGGQTDNWTAKQEKHDA